MFIGRYNYSLDEKGRLVIPSKYRAEISENLYLMKGFEGCLSIYKASDFEKKLNILAEQNFEKNVNRTYQRLLLSTAVELPLDKAGRILIPTSTLSDYSIGKDVVIVGLINHFEIWDAKAWSEYENANKESFEKFAEELFNDEK